MGCQESCAGNLLTCRADFAPKGARPNGDLQANVCASGAPFLPQPPTKYAPSALKSLGILKRGTKTYSSGLLLRIKGFLPDGGTIESHGVTRGLSTPRFLLTI